MDIFDLMWTRRSIRKYQDRQIPRQALEQVLRAGSWAPNAGGGQRTMLVGLRDRTLVERLGRVNAACMDRSRLLGGHVSAEQPSIIDDPAIKSGFYGAPPSALYSRRRIFSTASRTPSAVRKIWYSPPPGWDLPPASSHGERRPLTTALGGSS